MNLLDRSVIYIVATLMVVYGFVITMSTVNISREISSQSEAFGLCSQIRLKDEIIWSDAEMVDGEVYCITVYQGNSYAMELSELISTIEDNKKQEVYSN